MHNRTAKVKRVLQEDFGITKPLRLAICCSGGGNRAMIGTLGILKAAAYHKFLDATTYLTGLSGSTWIIAPWSYMYLHGLLSRDYEQSLAEFEDMLTKVLNYECTIGMNNKCLPEALKGAQVDALTDHIKKRFAYQQRVSGVDLYGAMIGNFALEKVGDKRLDVTWSSLNSLAQSGAIPLPLCSSVFDLKKTIVKKSGYRTEYEWFESGPFEAGSSVLGYIPVWSLGSEFKDGKLISHNPEYPLSFYLGIYGSAFAVSLNDIIDKGIPKDNIVIMGEKVTVPIDTWLRVLLDKIDKNIRSDRSDYIHAQFPNYAVGVSTSALQKEDLGMFDGGMYFNLPLPLLFDRPERDVDVVIMYDSNPADVNTLVDASRYFKRKGIAMPDMEKVKKSKLLSKPMTVFNDPRKKSYNSSMPTLMYFPTPKQSIFKAPYKMSKTDYPYVTEPIDNNKSPYTTLNFRYNPDQLKNLADTMEAIFDSQVDTMKNVLQQVAEKRA